jgi:hypothetical protein
MQTVLIHQQTFGDGPLGIKHEAQVNKLVLRDLVGPSQGYTASTADEEMMLRGFGLNVCTALNSYAKILSPKVTVPGRSFGR